LHHFNWTLGIGPATFGGWVIVVLYFLTMISCWATARTPGVKERRIWVAISILFLGLWLNRQLDLQSGFTDVGRIFARAHGWYGHRQPVQIAFIIAAAVICFIAVMALLVWQRRAPVPTWFALVGTTLVIGYVLIRTASFHRIDRFRWNSELEIASISVVLLASQWRQRRAKVSRASGR
jgi:hypothetical protein